MRSAAEDAAAVPAIDPAWAPPSDFPRIGPDDPAGLALRRYVTDQARAFLDAGPRNGHTSPEGYQRMRVAARRLRAALRTFGSLVEPGWARGLTDELVWVGGVLAGEWERQAALDRLYRDLDDLGDSEGSRRAHHLLSRRLSRELSLLRADAVTALGSPRYRLLADRLSVAGHELPATDAASAPCQSALPGPVLTAVRRLDTAVGQLDPAGPDEDWHAVGRLARQSRYAAELCAPVFGPPARMFGRQLERVTEILGRHQEAATAARVASAAASTPRIAPSTSFALGVLHATERAAVVTARRDLVDVWPEVSGKRWRRWLTRT